MVEVRSEYQTKTAIAALSRELRQNGAIVLADVLSPQAFAEVSLANMGGWKHLCIPDRGSYSVRSSDKSPSILGGVSEYVRVVAGKDVSKGVSLRIRAGDYTLLHDAVAVRPGVRGFLFLDDWYAVWGGLFYVVKNGKTMFSFVPRKNALLVVDIRRGERYFFKYVNHFAGKNALRVISV